MRSMFFFFSLFICSVGPGKGRKVWKGCRGGGRRNWLADTCAFVLVPLIVINTLVIVYELVLG